MSEKILNAVRGNDSETVRALLESNPSLINVKSGDLNWPLLHYAASSRGNLGMCELLVKKGADVNGEDVHKRTALHLACMNGGRVDICQFLIANGANVNIIDDRGATPLYLAVHNNRSAICRLLIENDANVNVVHGDGLTPLISASQRGYLEICRLLIENGADVNIKRDEFGWTALRYAAFMGHLETCRLLVEHGSIVNLDDTRVRSAPIREYLRNEYRKGIVRKVYQATLCDNTKLGPPDPLADRFYSNEMIRMVNKYFTAT